MGKGQDPEVKGNPFSAAWDESERLWLVQSASATDTVYRVDANQGRCSCDAPHRCWHLGIIPLAEELASAQAAARSYYANWRLHELQAEDARLREIVARAAEETIAELRAAWFERGQLSVVGEEILDRLLAMEDAA